MIQFRSIGIVLSFFKVVLVCFSASEAFRVHVTTKSRELSDHKAKITSGTEQK